MRKTLLLLLLPVFSLSYGQGRARLDSLLNLLTNKYSNRQDTGKVRLLYQVSFEYALLFNDSANAYAGWDCNCPNKLATNTVRVYASSG